MSAQTRATLKNYFLTGDTPSAAQFANTIDSFYSLLSDFQFLFGKINQSGTGVPVLTTFFSSLSFVPTFTYDGVGQYHMNSVGNLSSAKVNLFIGTSELLLYPPNTFFDASPDAINISTYNNSAILTNGCLVDNPILILKIP